MIDTTARLQHYASMETYLDTLIAAATQHNINLKKAFLQSGVRDSTYYRAMAGHHSLRYETAKQVYDYIVDKQYETWDAAKNKINEEKT